MAKTATAVLEAPTRRKVTPEQVEKIVEMRDAGTKWPEIAAKVGLGTNSAQLEYRRAKVGKTKTATAEAIKAARDTESLSWDQIIVTFGLSHKGMAQKLYRDAGGNPAKSSVGRGGRFLPEGREKPAAKPKAPKAPAKTPAGKVDLATATDEEVVKALTGKRIVVQLSQRMGGDQQTIKIASGLVTTTNKVGKPAIKFTDETGKARVVAIAGIVSYKR